MESKKIRITESQLKALVKEGISWSKGQDGSVGLSVNRDMTDGGNKGVNSVDTRVFGSKDQVLNGDGTTHWATKSVAQSNESRAATVQFFKNVADYVRVTTILSMPLLSEQVAVPLMSAGLSLRNLVMSLI